MHWTQVVTDPLGLAGFALALVFSALSRIVKQKRSRTNDHLMLVAYALAASCVLGGLLLAYQRQSRRPSQNSNVSPQPTPSSPTMSIGVIEQTHDGVAVAGVQGNVTVNGSTTKQAPKQQAQQK